MYASGNADLSAVELERSQSPIYKHVAKTYAWMFLGLAITFAVGELLNLTGLVYALFLFRAMPILLLVGELALVWFLTARLGEQSVGTTRALFVAYSALSGVTFSAVLALYGVGQVFLFFGLAAVFFGSMAVAGLVTKRDVSGFRYIVLFGLIALLLMELVNLFVKLDGFETLICFLGIAIFLGITTYDSKRMKDFYYAFEGNQAMLDKVSIYSALQLYLDFLNLFLYLIRLLGRRK